MAKGTLIGEEIKAARDALTWTLRDLAKDTGLSAAYLSDIERGARVPPAHTVRTICNAFMDADSAEWFWLWLEDQVGRETVAMMRTHAVKAAHQPQETER